VDVLLDVDSGGWPFYTCCHGTGLPYDLDVVEPRGWIRWTPPAGHVTNGLLRRHMSRLPLCTFAVGDIYAKKLLHARIFCTCGGVVVDAASTFAPSLDDMTLVAGAQCVNFVNYNDAV